MILETVTFRIPEILSLVGLIQCVYILVYMAFRSGDAKYAVIPFAYFFVLAAAFFLDFGYRFIGGDLTNYMVWQWMAWFAGPPLSVLLVIQVAQVTRLPGWRNLWVLLPLPAAFVAARVGAGMTPDCTFPDACPLFSELLVAFGLAAGALSMLGVWLQRGMLDILRQEREGQARFWLVITLLFMNGAFMGLMLLGLGPWLDDTQTTLVRTIVGLGLVYLSGTSLFRIFPQTVKLTPREVREEKLSHEEKVLAQKIERLLDMDKVYQEPTYSRSDLARELDAAETVISRVVNLYFGKSFPQVLNERRVADAQRLLRQTPAPMKQVAEDVGFNSMATFNRVFREATGQTPTAYRQGKATEGA